MLEFADPASLLGSDSSAELPSTRTLWDAMHEWKLPVAFNTVLYPEGPHAAQHLIVRVPAHSGLRYADCLRGHLLLRAGHRGRWAAIRLPREYVGDWARGPHQDSLFDMNADYADVLSLEDVVVQLRSYSQA